MESIRVYIAVKSPLIRLGIKTILHQTGLPVYIKEIFDTNKLLLILQKDSSGLYLISSEMIPPLYPRHHILDMQTILVQESQVSYHADSLIFNDSFNTNDNERSIYLKIEKCLKFLSKDILKKSDEFISPREKEVLKSVALGKTNKEIAEMLFISPHTVVTHRKNLTYKLGIKTIAGLTVYALLHGVISSEDLK